MLDTVQLNWKSSYLSEADIASVLSEYPTHAYHEEYLYPGQAIPWRGYKFTDEQLGTVMISVSSSMETSEPYKLVCERSIGKYICGTNVNQLSRQEAQYGFLDWSSACEKRFPFAEAEGRECGRVDFFHQQEVGDTGSLLRGLRSALGGATVYKTGVSLMNRRNWMSRLYDKGIEAKDADFMGVLRKEEQLRAGRGSLTKYFDCRTGEIYVDEVVRVMNSKWGEGEFMVQDKTAYAEMGVQGLAALALKENPELWDTFRRNVCYRTRTKYQGLVASLVMNEYSVDLRVKPESFEKCA